MNQILYYQNPYLKAIDTEITSIKPHEKGFLITLADNLFYPEGGGQPADQGTIGDQIVRHVFRQDNIIYHLVDHKPQQMHVHCQLDWKHRFDHMQQHGGQHVLSAAAEKLFRYRTVGFHLSETYTTIDLDTHELNDQSLMALEQEANRIIFANIPILTYIVDADQIKEIPLRKAPTVDENIRIVELKDYDAVACCGTHPNHTGEIGLIKIVRCEKIRRQIRLVFVCGFRALNNYQMKTQTTNRLIELTSVTEPQIVPTIEKLIQTEKAKNKLINQLQQKILENEADNLWQQAEIWQGNHLVCKDFTQLTIKDLQMLTQCLIRHEKTLTLLSCSSDKAQFIFARSEDINIHLGKLLKESLKMVNGRGGGNAKHAQGGCKNPEHAPKILDFAREKVKAFFS